jgi:hypothetical protein
MMLLNFIYASQAWSALAAAFKKRFWGPLFPTLTQKVFSFVEGMIAHCTEEINLLKKAEHE